TPPPDTYTLSLHDALPISRSLYGFVEALAEQHAVGKPSERVVGGQMRDLGLGAIALGDVHIGGDEAHVLDGSAAHIENRSIGTRSEEHTSELQSLAYLVCR